MGPELTAVETDSTPPRRADVVIIGGGIAGVSTLLSLSEQGVSAVQVEKGRLAGEQSSRNWGFTHPGARSPGKCLWRSKACANGIAWPRAWAPRLGLPDAGACVFVRNAARGRRLRTIARPSA